MSYQIKMFNKHVFCQLKTKSEGIWNNIGWIKKNIALTQKNCMKYEWHPKSKI